MIVSLEEARQRGLRHYFTGVPCCNGHTASRYTSTRQCTECQRQNRIKWRLANPEKEQKSRILGLRKWTAANPERKRELAAKYNAKPESSAKNVERVRKWKTANPERHRENASTADRNRRANIKGSEGSHTKQDVADILLMQSFKCASCGIGIKDYDSRHVDHTIPVSKGGRNDKTNLQLLCKQCNLNKSDKDPIRFAQERGRLL